MSALISHYKHKQLTSLLRREITERYSPGHPLPSQKLLMRQYCVSQATISSALQPLFEEGLIYSVAGKGTFVSAMQVGNPPASGQATGAIHCIISTETVFSQDRNPWTAFALNRIVKGISANARTSGRHFHLTPLPLHGSPELFASLAQTPDCGFVFLEYRYFEFFIQHCLDHSIPCAAFGMHHQRNLACNQLWLDMEDGCRQMTTFIISRGHTCIGFLGDRYGSTRFTGFQSAMAQAGLSCPASALGFTASHSAEDARLEALRLLNENPRLTAMVCSNDRRARGAYEASRQLGRKIEITGMDNFYPPAECKWFSMNLDFEQVGRELCRLAGKPVDSPPECIRLVPHWD
jgi:DNA-binding LacI/PurR family transcriptional regulator